VKKLRKKFKDVKVEITFAESKEYDTVKETFIDNVSDNDKIKKEKPVSRVLSKIKKKIQEVKRHRKEKGAVSRKKHIPVKKSEGGSSKLEK